MIFLRIFENTLAVSEEKPLRDSLAMKDVMGDLVAINILKSIEDVFWKLTLTTFTRAVISENVADYCIRLNDRNILQFEILIDLIMESRFEENV